MKIVYINGDGIGKEVMPATRQVMSYAMDGEIEWIEARAGLEHYKDGNEPLPAPTVELIRAHGLAIKGPTTTPGGEGFESVNVALRRALDLYVGLRPVFSLGLEGRPTDMRIALFRENIEGLYACEEVLNLDAQEVRLTARFTRDAMYRLARAAFLYAKELGYPRVTYVDKQNIHKVWGRLYHQAFTDVAGAFPEIPSDHRLVDATNMFLSLAPQSWGVIVTENMFGDILADHLAALMGGLGVAPGANIGYGSYVAEAVHGSWPERAGEGIANPTALMLSGAMLLEHTGATHPASRIREAVCKAIAQGERTGDLGGKLTTMEFTQAVLRRL